MDDTETKATKQADVIKLDGALIMINKIKYRLIENHDNGFDQEKIEERYNNVLDKYDFIVGDWGYDQLRFKGFYLDKRIESNIDNKISHLEDYLVEYCNFGCAYFVLEREEKLPLTKPKHHRSNNSHRNHTNSRRNNSNRSGENGNSRRNKTNRPNDKTNSRRSSSNRANENAGSRRKNANRPNNKTNVGRNNMTHPQKVDEKNSDKPKIRRRKSEQPKANVNKRPQNNKRNTTQSGARSFKIRKIDK